MSITHSATRHADGDDDRVDPATCSRSAPRTARVERSEVERLRARLAAMSDERWTKT
jgi:hypothetical protein